MTDETRTRFLAAIAKHVPVDRVIEVHLFGAIRQGGIESGVAVIAVELEQAITLDVDGGYIPEGDVAEAAALESTEEVIVHDQLADEVAFVADETTAEPSPYADDEPTAPIVTGAAEEPTTAELPDMVEELDEASAVDDLEDDAAPAPPEKASRYTVYSARYRHILKGMDRGKWEVSVTEVADAPLLTVDAVVRGVQRRSGDVDETVRLSGDEFRAALPAPMAS
jgi:hypothetical protein